MDRDHEHILQQTEIFSLSWGKVFNQELTFQKKKMSLFDDVFWDKWLSGEFTYQVIQKKEEEEKEKK